MCIQEIVNLVDYNETVCVCNGTNYEHYFQVNCAMLRMLLYPCFKISTMSYGQDKGKLCLHTDNNSYLKMAQYFKIV